MPRYGRYFHRKAADTRQKSVGIDRTQEIPKTTTSTTTGIPGEGVLGRRLSRRIVFSLGKIVCSEEGRGLANHLLEGLTVTA